MRRLVLLRHAKSAWPDGVSDYQRPLAPRGQEAASRLGHYLAAQGLLPDLLLVSPALRTRETLALVSEGLPLPAGVVVEEPRLYDASISTLLQVVRAVPAETRSLMLIGHNPSLAEMAVLLSNPRDGSRDDIEAMSRKFPTAALAVIDFARDDWHLLPRQGRLDRFVTPRSLGGVDED